MASEGALQVSIACTVLPCCGRGRPHSGFDSDIPRVEVRRYLLKGCDISRGDWRGYFKKKRAAPKSGSCVGKPNTKLAYAFLRRRTMSPAAPSPASANTEGSGTLATVKLG